MSVPLPVLCSSELQQNYAKISYGAGLSNGSAETIVACRVELAAIVTDRHRAEFTAPIAGRTINKPRIDAGQTSRHTVSVVVPADEWGAFDVRFQVEAYFTDSAGVNWYRDTHHLLHDLTQEQRPARAVWDRQTAPSLNTRYPL